MQAAPNLGMLDWLSFIASFLLVLALLGATIYFLRRARRVGGRAGHAPQLDVYESLGPRQRLLMVKAKDRELLIAMSPDRIETLASWSAEELREAAATAAAQPQPAKPAGGIRNMLAQATRGKASQGRTA
jgi:flagellar biogenesis protein FliO